MAHFNKRHYQFIAQVMQDAYEQTDMESQDCIMARQIIINNLASAFGQDNPNFHRELFLQACKPGSNVRAKTVKGATMPHKALLRALD